MPVKFAIRGDDLDRAAAWAARLCPAKPVTPILQGVMVDAADRLTLSAFDFEIGGSVTVSATVTEPGRALIPGSLLAAVAKAYARDTHITFTCDSTKVTVRAGRNTSTLPALDADDYPIMPGMGAAVAKLDGADLRRALDRVLPAADRSGTAPLYASLCAAGDDDGLTLVATDRYRMAVATIPWQPTDPDADLELIVPVDFMEAAARATGSVSAGVELSTDGGVVALATPAHRLTGRLTATDWPLWRGLLPAEPVAEATFVVDELASAIDRALAVSDDKQPIRLDVDETGFDLSVWGGDNRGGRSVAAVADYTGEEARAFGVNPKFLRAALNTMGTDMAVMRFGLGMAKPVDIVPLTADGKPEDGFRHLVMPVHPDKVRRASG